MSDVKAVVTEYALELGFDQVRVTSAQEFAQDRAVTLERLRAGLMDGLPWFNETRVQRGADPSSLLAGARSIICLGLSYHQNMNADTKGRRPSGRVALYAWGRDYHKVMKKMMRSYVEGAPFTPGQRIRGPLVRRRWAHAGPGGGEPGWTRLVREEHQCADSPAMAPGFFWGRW